MKTILIFTTLVALLLAADQGGRYVADFSGRYVPTDEGRYYPDYSGRYIPDGKGGYIFDGNGKYANDASGRYSEDLSKYRYTTTTTTTTTPKPTPPPPPIVYKTYDDEGHWMVIRQLRDFDTSGGYHWEYETENEINAEESGKLFKEGTKDEGIKAKGFFMYVGPDNLVYEITYTADENGFIPIGKHIPTPPPIPEPILRALKHEHLLDKKK